MKYRNILIFALWFILTGGLYAQAQQPELNCDFQGVSIKIDFPTARVNGCEQRGDDIHLMISPEIKPINPSPWYAFRVESKADKKVSIILNYTYGTHRYWPKVSLDGLKWNTLQPKNIRLNKDKTRAHLTLDMGANTPKWIAAQEIFSNAQHNSWMVQQARKFDFLDLYKMGDSVEGRPIYKLETKASDVNQKVVMLIGRQHPPEITGALAMVPFIETLLSDSSLAQAFREKFRLIIVPNLNPDGVEKGNWRGNATGKDLNRDWGDFSQPETRLMKAELDRLQQGGQGKLALMLDFHSTYENLIYTQTEEDVTDPPQFAVTWHGAIKARVPDISFKHDPRHNPTLPTSKAYVYNNFGVPAITYEMGDNSDRQEIRKLAIVAAEEMMRILLMPE